MTPEEQAADARWRAAEEARLAVLRPRLTPDFLETLALAARTRGWDDDYVEIRNFVEAMFKEAGQPVPDLTPFEYGG